MEFHGTFVLGVAIPWNPMEFGVGIKFHGTYGILWNFPFDLEKFHGIPWNFWRVPWNSMELWNIDINKFHNWGSVFHGLLHDLVLLYIRQTISNWNIEIFKFASNFLAPLILLKWRYSILNGGLLYIYLKYDYYSIYIYLKYDIFQIRFNTIFFILIMIENRFWKKK